MRIYNYDNQVATIDLMEIPKTISVTIVSGDEIVTAIFGDGEAKTYDVADYVGNPRVMQFYDGTYIVTGEKKIKAWLNYRPADGRTALYARAELFGW